MFLLVLFKKNINEYNLLSFKNVNNIVKILVTVAGKQQFYNTHDKKKKYITQQSKKTNFKFV